MITVLSLLAGAALQLRPYKRPIMTWVSPYSVSRTRERLNLPGVSDGITHLSMQFWVPTKAGKAVLLGADEVSDDSVAKLRDWAHAKGIRAMLCVFNGAQEWDWPLAKAAFGDHRDAFVKSLVDEMDRHHLDGIDIDLEGPAPHEPDKPVFIAFMRELSKVVRAKGKQLTVDSFAYVWNAPNEGWWPELFPLVDAITSMGYEQIGRSADAWASYAAQEKAAGADVAKLQIGAPSDKDKWQGNTSLEQLNWILKDGHAGVAIWDAQMRAASWKSAEVWAVLKAIRG